LKLKRNNKSKGLEPSCNLPLTGTSIGKPGFEGAEEDNEREAIQATFKVPFPQASRGALLIPVRAEKGNKRRQSFKPSLS
jgi:hypothetical protein